MQQERLPAGPSSRTADRRASVVLRRGALAGVVVAAVLAMLLLARWQWHRGQQRHALLNYSYAVEWVLFAGLTVAGVVTLARDARRPPSAAPRPAPAAGVQVGPPLGDDEDVDVTWVRLARRFGLQPRTHG